MVTFKCHAAGTGCPLAAEQDQTRAEQVRVQHRASKAPRQLLRHLGGLLSMSGWARVTYPALLWLAVGKGSLPGMRDNVTSGDGRVRMRGERVRRGFGRFPLLLPASHPLLTAAFDHQ